MKLDAALPAYENALKALKVLKKSDIVEVKAMKTPPPAVVLTMETSKSQVPGHPLNRS